MPTDAPSARVEGTASAKDTAEVPGASIRRAVTRVPRRLVTGASLTAEAPGAHILIAKWLLAKDTTVASHTEGVHDVLTLAVTKERKIRVGYARSMERELRAWNMNAQRLLSKGTTAVRPMAEEYGVSIPDAQQVQPTESASVAPFTGEESGANTRDAR